ncbi:MAG: preprotein translocase subunit SecE [Gammaproteobacteria bacterium]
MAAKEEVVASGLDTAKLGLAVALLLAGVGGFYYYADQSLLYRVLGLVAVAAAAVGVMMTTALGRNTWDFLQESRTEVRKMVWPTRTETVQTTLIVIAMVIIVGIFLWLLDMLLAWLVRFVIG